jgi:hypothetical protein
MVTLLTDIMLAMCIDKSVVNHTHQIGTHALALQRQAECNEGISNFLFDKPHTA